METLILAHRIQFTIPTEPTLSRATVEDVARQLSATFGGCTAQDAFGYWQDGDGNLVAEHVTLLYSLAGEQAFNDAIAENVPARIAEHILDVLRQQAVLYEVDGVGYLAERPPAIAQVPV